MHVIYTIIFIFLAMYYLYLCSIFERNGQFPVKRTEGNVKKGRHLAFQK